MSKKVLICQNRTCKLSASAKILKTFQKYSSPEIEIVGCGCLGKCGNGVTVLILPQKIWYNSVSLEHVKTIVEKHLLTRDQIY